MDLIYTMIEGDDVIRIGPMAYRLELPSELSRIHNVFHVSMLKKYILDSSHMLETPPIELEEDLHLRFNQSLSLIEK